MRWTKLMYVNKFGLASYFVCISVWLASYYNIINYFTVKLKFQIRFLFCLMKVLKKLFSNKWTFVAGSSEEEKNSVDARYLTSKLLGHLDIILLSVILFIYLNIAKLICSSFSYTTPISSLYTFELRVMSILLCF